MPWRVVAVAQQVGTPVSSLAKNSRARGCGVLLAGTDVSNASHGLTCCGAVFSIPGAFRPLPPFLSTLWNTTQKSPVPSPCVSTLLTDTVKQTQCTGCGWVVSFQDAVRLVLKVVELVFHLCGVWMSRFMVSSQWHHRPSFLSAEWLLIFVSNLYFPDYQWAFGSNILHNLSYPGPLPTRAVFLSEAALFWKLRLTQGMRCPWAHMADVAHRVSLWAPRSTTLLPRLPLVMFLLRGYSSSLYTSNFKTTGPRMILSCQCFY